MKVKKTASVWTMENNLAKMQIELFKSHIIHVYIPNYTGINK